MGIILPTGVANNLNTPGAITDFIANLPDAADIATGTIFVAPDVPAIYTNDNGTWKALSGGGGAAVNPTSHFIPYNLSGVFEDSFLYVDIDSPGIFKTVYSSNDVGLYCSFANSFYSLSDLGLGIFINAAGGGLSGVNTITIGSDGVFPGFMAINVDNGSTQRIYTSNAGIITGFDINTANQVFGFGKNFTPNREGTGLILVWDQPYLTAYLGDFDSGIGNNTYLSIDDNNFIIKTHFSNVDAGLQIDFNTDKYYLGDFDNLKNQGTSIIIDDPNKLIYTKSLGSDIGILLNSSIGLYWIGDYNGVGIGNTYLSIDDNAGKIQFYSNAAKYNFANMPSYADNAAALAAGLVVGDLYRHDGLLESQDQLRIVH